MSAPLITVKIQQNIHKNVNGVQLIIKQLQHCLEHLYSLRPKTCEMTKELGGWLQLPIH
jgi:hypothetical protein